MQQRLTKGVIEGDLSVFLQIVKGGIDEGYTGCELRVTGCAGCGLFSLRLEPSILDTGYSILDTCCNVVEIPRRDSLPRYKRDK